jgi:NADH:ubiquinone oxidoreductase subunit 3 (subunit A)
MNSRWLVLFIIIMVATFTMGFMISHSSGIQPGYFEKAEAPAYGVGGETVGADVGKKAADYYKSLYQEE